MSWPDLPSTRWNPCVTLLLDSLLLPLPVSVDDELRQAALRIMLRISGRFLPPQAEDEEAAAEGEQDADDDAVCRSIRPTMCQGEHVARQADHHTQRPEAGGGERRELAREDGTAHGEGTRDLLPFYRVWPCLVARVR
uniref:p2C44 n=1 Tax=Arundo donax TaxID=35708 RepID=A0A0A9F591_ARUDO